MQLADASFNCNLHLIQPAPVSTVDTICGKIWRGSAVAISKLILLVSQIFGESVSNIIIIGVTLIWLKPVAAVHKIAILALFKFGGQAKNHQTAKLNSPPNKLCIRYSGELLITKQTGRNI